MALNVLVVDDSAVMRKMIIKTLTLIQTPFGEVHEASNGAEALGVLEAHRVDVALVDLNMPVMDGEEFLDRVRRDPGHADLPVIIVSTESSEARIAALKRKGAWFVHKPFSPEAFRQAIQSIPGVFQNG